MTNNSRTNRQRFSTWVLALALALSLTASLPSFAGDSFTGKVRWVSDGDTLVVASRGRNIVVQIAGIDAPELSQEFGEAARDFLAEILQKQRVTVEVLETKENRSVVARLTLAGDDVATTLIERGYAWAAEGASGAGLKEAEKIARAAKDGLWASSEPKPPWEFRKAA